MDVGIVNHDYFKNMRVLNTAAMMGEFDDKFLIDLSLSDLIIIEEKLMRKFANCCFFLDRIKEGKEKIMKKSKLEKKKNRIYHLQNYMSILIDKKIDDMLDCYESVANESN